MTTGSNARSGAASRDDTRRESSSDGRQQPNNAPSTGVQAAGMRAIAARMVAFYFRAPVKAFFRGRIDYMGYARAINPHFNPGSKWSWRMTTPVVLAHAVRTEGWSFIPNQILPPLLANTCIGAVLYTTYLHSLPLLHEPSSYQTKRTFPPPPLSVTLVAGFMAGGIQSIVAAPFDALQTRFRTSDILHGKYKTIWHYAGHKLQSIGLQGIFAGWTLSFCKDAFGSAVFFATFETMKSQAYYEFVKQYYGNKARNTILENSAAYPVESSSRNCPVIKPHYMLEPAFLLLAGMSASVTSQLIQHPLVRIQDVHYYRLEALDAQAKQDKLSSQVIRRCYHAYQKTYTQCRRLARRAGGWRKYLYRDFAVSTIRQVPSTSAGLIVFEVVRRKYSLGSEDIVVQHEDARILLT